MRQIPATATKARTAPTRLKLGGWLLAGALSLAPGAARAQSPAAATLATVTILDGNAVLLRGAGKWQVAEGVRLQSQDVVETPADARLVRIEFPDGVAMSLGPGTRLLFDPHFIGERGRSARVYLLRGWIKLNAATPAAAAKPGASTPWFASPAMDLLTASGSVVASVQAGANQAFVESGDLSLQERDADSAVGSVQTLRSGEFFARIGSARSAVTPRPAPAFVQQLPRSFMDTLPARAGLFKDRDTPPKPLGDVAYADAKDWLTAEAALRRGSINRWRPLTRTPAFRNALVANMQAHPEWDRVLFPEKYSPKPAQALSGKAGG